MPSFNRGNYLRESIQCIQNQTYTKWELLIIDNGSSDKETLEVIEQVQIGAFQDHRIRAWKLNSDYGVGSVPRNFGIAQASGDFITFLDDDDLMSPDRLQSAVDIFEANKDIDMVICDVTTIDQFGKLIKYEIRKPSDPELLRFMQLFQFTVYFQATILRYDRLKPYIFNVPMVGQDREQFHRLIFAHNAKIARVTEYQGAYRQHQKQITGLSTKNLRVYKPDHVVQEMYFPIAFPEVFGPHSYYLYPDEQLIYDDFYITLNQKVLTNDAKNVYKMTLTETQDDLEKLLHHRSLIQDLHKDFSCLVRFFADNKHYCTDCQIKNQTLVNEYLDKFDEFFKSKNTSVPMLKFFQQIRRVFREKQINLYPSFETINEIEQSFYYDEQINQNTCPTHKNINGSSIKIIAHIIEDSEQVKKSIESVLQQSFKNWVLLIIDNQKQHMQSSRLVISAFMKKDLRIKLIQVSSYNELETQGEFVAFFNLFGEMPSYRLCIQQNYMHFNSHVDILGGAYEKDEYRLLSENEDKIAISNQQLRLRQLFGNQISPSTILMRQNCKECISDYISDSDSKPQNTLMSFIYFLIDEGNQNTRTHSVV